MRSLRLPLGLLLGLGLAAQICLAAGLMEEDAGRPLRVRPIRPPQADFKADAQRFQQQLLGKHPAYRWTAPSFNLQFDDLKIRLSQLPAQPSQPAPSIDPGIVRWADPSIDPRIVFWADPAIDPGIALPHLVPAQPGEK